MANQNDKQEFVELEQINAELTQSLKRCRKLLFDCRSKLAANSNSPHPTRIATRLTPRPKTGADLFPDYVGQ